MESQLNRWSSYLLIGLSTIALLCVLSGYLPGHHPQTDEGTAAHIFQLSIAALVPAILTFAATADWRRARQSARPLLVPGAMLVAAFGALYYLEHYL